MTNSEMNTRINQVMGDLEILIKAYDSAFAKRLARIRKHGKVAMWISGAAGAVAGFCASAAILNKLELTDDFVSGMTAYEVGLAGTGLGFVAGSAISVKIQEWVEKNAKKKYDDETYNEVKNITSLYLMASHIKETLINNSMAQVSCENLETDVNRLWDETSKAVAISMGK